MNPNQPSPMVRMWLLIVLIIVIIAAGGFYYFTIFNKNSESSTATASPVASSSAKTSSPSPSASASSLTYTNTTYGFTLTFPASWKGYKMKEKVFTDSVITYYVTVPTTDPSAVASDSNDAGYYSSFAITVYTLAQWDTLQAQEGPRDTLITKNTTYAFGWSQANGVPASDFGSKSDDIKTIIESFKLK